MTSLVRRQRGALGAITLDVDGVRHYHAIHGLPPPVLGDPPVERGVQRFLALCDALDVKATLFVVTRDLDDAHNRGRDDSGALGSLLAQAVRDGHEVASHSHAHAYDLSRRAPAEIEADVARSVRVLEQVTGRRPRGFRAPGYNLSEALLDALEKQGFTYDSSVMPSPLYWAARAAIIGAKRFMGTPSSSIVGKARAFTTSRAPYRPRRGQHAKQARSRIDGRDLVEVPIATLPFGVPWLGTTLAASPLPLGATSTAVALTAKAPVVLELHAIDLCDAQDGFARELVRMQRELAVPLKRKLHRLEAAVRMLTQVREVVTVEELARGWA